ncbi:MAG: AbrB/MazE/SpoVT family DNA-binding domain-containing protein [Nitrosarchaeum sp.]|nr:AbrB/MazE/SpoVT family DNA-binding domain-containing protein [Nitrosarchaeum sp.]
MSKKEVLGMTTITYKYQVTIPKKLREKHRLKEGDTIIFVEEDGKVFLKKSTDMS